MPDRPWPKLDPTALHGVFGDLVEVIAPHTEGDPVALLTNALALFGSAVGSGPHVLVGRNAHPARLNIAQVGETSRARKGQALAEVRAPFVYADPGWADRIMSGLASGEGLIAAVRDPDDDEDRAAPDKRLLIVEPEFARVLRVCAREGSTLSAIVRQCWDDGQLRVMTRRDPLVASAAHVSIVTHITADELLRTLSGTEAANGFGNRFAFFVVRRSQLLPSGGDFTDEAVAELGRLLRDRLQQARKVCRVRRSADAEERWAQLYAEIAETDTPGLVGAVTARAEAQLLRFSLVYALGDGSRTIEVEHLDAAWALWRFSAASAEFIFGDSTGTLADRVLAVLIEAGTSGLSRADLHKACGGHVTRRELDSAVTELEALGKAFTAEEPTGGRPKIITFASEATG